VALLVAAVAVVSGLAWVTWQAQRRQAVATDAFLRGHANLVSQRLANRMASEIYLASNAVFRRAGVGSAAPKGSGGIPLSRILEAADEVKRCRCATPLPPDYAFQVDLRTLDLGTAGPVSPSSAAAVRLAQAVGRRVRQLEPQRNWDFALLPTRDEGHAFIIAAPMPVGADGADVVYGFAFDSALVRRAIVGECLRNVEAFPGVPLGVRGERPIWVRVDGGEGADPVYQDSAWASGTPSDGLMGRAAVGPLFGDLSVATMLAPPTRRALTASFPSVSVLVLVALTLATAIAFAAAIRFARRAHELAVERGQFTSSISHELRTPLTQILLYAETLALDRPSAPGARQRAVDTIVRESRRLLGLVQNLLQHARADRPPAARPPAPLVLGSVVRDVVTDYELLARERGARVTCADRSDDAAARVSPDEARQVIVNLLDNAVRHGPRDQHVGLELACRDGWIVLTVDDQGPGVPRQDRERIWEPFQRVDREADAPATGSGLGLSVVRSLVTVGGGWVRVDDAPGGGARFSVGWPVVDPPAPGAPVTAPPRP
jgi:signal transduction histidine kinase